VILSAAVVLMGRTLSMKGSANPKKRAVVSVLPLSSATTEGIKHHLDFRSRAKQD